MDRDFIPSADPDLLIWFNNFNTKFAAYATTLGFVAADVTAVQNDFNTLSWVINAVQVFKDESRERVAYKDILIKKPVGTPVPTVPVSPNPAPPATISTPGIIGRTRALANRIKALPTYTEAIGRDMGIVGGTVPPPAIIKPTLTVEVVGASLVRVKFKKSGYTGVQLESQRNNETGWTVLDKVNFSPYEDVRPLLAANAAETRRYRALYLKKNAPVGQYSDVVTALIG